MRDVPARSSGTKFFAGFPVWLAVEALKGIEMSMWWTSNTVSLALCVATGVRVMQARALALASPPALRQAREHVVRIITVVAGH